MIGEPISIKLIGVSQIQMHLRELPERVKRKHLRKAMEESAEVIRAEAQANAAKIVRKRPYKDDFFLFLKGPDLRRHLKNCVVKAVHIRKSGAYGLIGFDNKKVHHGHLVEFGTRPHKIMVKMKRNKYLVFDHPGSSPNPIMRPAFANKADAAADLLIQKLIGAVDMEASNGR